MAEELLYDGMKYFPEYSAYQPLMAATFSAQYVEVHLRERIARDRVVPSVEPEDHPEALAARIQALEEQPNRVRLFGPCQRIPRPARVFRERALRSWSVHHGTAARS